jgi:hypothetical protein
VAVCGNALDGYGGGSMVLVQTAARLLLADNRCVLTSDGQSVAQVSADAVIASNNHLQSLGPGPALRLDLVAGTPFTVLGNVTEGGIFVNGSSLGPPWQQLNA